MDELTELKALSYPAEMSMKDRAIQDKKKVKKSPDISKKKFSYYCPEKKMYIFADKKKTFENMKNRLSHK